MVPQWGTHQTVHLPNQLPAHEYLKVRGACSCSRCLIVILATALLVLNSFDVRSLITVFHKGNGAPWLDPYSAQRVATAVPTGRHHTCQDHG